MNPLIFLKRVPSLHELKAHIATEADIPFIRLLVELEVPHGHFSNEMKRHAARERWRADVASDIARATQSLPHELSTQLLWVGRNRVGLCILRTTPAHDEIELHLLIVTPEHRRRGFARENVIGLMNACRDGGKRLLIRCFPASTGMIALVTSLGFAERYGAGIEVRHFVFPPDRTR